MKQAQQRLFFCSLQLGSMSKFFSLFRAGAFGFGASAAVITAGVLTAFMVATIIVEDQRVYNKCLLKHQSADYCRLIVSGR